MSRRFRTQRNFNTRVPVCKLVCFQLGKERYAIAIDRVHRVLNEFTIHGVLESDRSLAKYNNEVITIIDPSQLFLSSRDDRERQYLIVCSLKEGEAFGIPVPEIPSVLEVPEDKFTEVPELYQDGGLSAAVEKIIQASDGKIWFYLNLEKLIPQSD